MKDFLEWVAGLNEVEELVEVPDDPNAPNLAKQGAEDFIRQSTQNFAGGPSRDGEIGDLAAVIGAARNGFASGKPAASIGGCDNEILGLLKTDNIYSKIWQAAQELQKQGMLDIQRGPNGMVIGKPQNVQALIQLVSNRQPGWENYPNYHTQFGQLIGYSPQNIQGFLQKRGLLQPQGEENVVAT